MKTNTYFKFSDFLPQNQMFHNSEFSLHSLNFIYYVENTMKKYSKNILILILYTKTKIKTDLLKDFEQASSNI